jgi:malate dehydrogenase (oxaloacetate-decarboxylating)
MCSAKTSSGNTQGTVDSHDQDPVFLFHKGGKIEVRATIKVRDQDSLSLAYTPGVATICEAIARDPHLAYNYTWKSNAILIVTDGTAVLGLGNIGPLAALPVMEGKSMLIKEFGGIDAVPMCLATQDTEEIIATVVRMAPAFGGIILEDISAPRCFEIETRLQGLLDIPVFHDDQHGTAVVVLAALTNAARLAGRKLGDLRVVVSGAGAAGVAITNMLLNAAIGDIVVADSRGIVARGRNDLTAVKADLANRTNKRNLRGSMDSAMAGADVFIGVSAGTVSEAVVASMAAKSIVFALANPNPEVHPDVARKTAAVIATGRSDFPNQINNVLVFPGVFRGALDVRASRITNNMKLAAAAAISAVVGDDLTADYIVPSVFDTRVAANVARAVAAAAHADGVARLR